MYEPFHNKIGLNGMRAAQSRQGKCCWPKANLLSCRYKKMELIFSESTGNVQKIGLYLCSLQKHVDPLTITWILFTGQYKSSRLKNMTIERYLLIISNMRSVLSNWVCSDETALCRCN